MNLINLKKILQGTFALWCGPYIRQGEKQIGIVFFYYFRIYCNLKVFYKKNVKTPAPDSGEEEEEDQRQSRYRKSPAPSLSDTGSGSRATARVLLPPSPIQVAISPRLPHSPIQVSELFQSCWSAFSFFRIRIQLFFSVWMWTRIRIELYKSLLLY